ncbi:MAG: response regulator, partial [Pyrinomonadaceae bacterium]
DDDDSRTLVGTMLKRQGADVVFASSTQEAIEAIKAGLPDVLVSDIGMPEQDGYELIRRVRELPPDKGGLAPAIALTGYATARDRERAITEGYQTHLAKPVEPLELVEAIAKLAGRDAETGDAETGDAETWRRGDAVMGWLPRQQDEG